MGGGGCQGYLELVGGGGCQVYLELAVAGEDADPLVVVVGDDDVTAGVHRHACRTLQLPRRPTSDPKPALKLSFIGENLYTQAHTNT